MWVLISGVVLAGGLLLLSAFGHWGERWGATQEEFDMALPGDEWLQDRLPVHVRMTRAVWIEAPADQVWPWIAQMGRGAGWYSYDALDNGRRPSARHVVFWIPPPQRGDASPIGYLRRLEPGRELAWWLPGGRLFGGCVRGVMFYRVTGKADRTRLIVRVQSDADGLLALPACWFFRILDTIMARRQLVGIRERVEEYGSRPADPVHPETGAREQFQLHQAIYRSGQQCGRPGREDAVRWRTAAFEDGMIVGSQSKDGRPADRDPAQDRGSTPYRRGQLRSWY